MGMENENRYTYWDARDVDWRIAEGLGSECSNNDPLVQKMKTRLMEIGALEFNGQQYIYDNESDVDWVVEANLLG